MIYGCGGGGGATSTAVTPPPPPPPACTATPLTSASKVKISVKTNGIYLISPGILTNFCLDSSNITLSKFKLQNWDPNQKSFVPIPVNFDPQGNMEFYGVGVNRNDYTLPNADYTETNVYWLVPGTPLQMSSKPVGSGGTPIPAMTTLHQEENHVYWPGMLNGTGIDHWFWERFTGISSNYLFTVNNYDSTFTSTPITLSFAVTSQTATTHQLDALLQIPDMSPSFTSTYAWTDTVPHIFTSAFTGSIRNGGLSSLQFPTTNASDEFYFNWLELEYPAKAYNDQIVFHYNAPLTLSYTFSINGFTQSSVELFDISDPKVPLAIANPSVISSGGGYQLTFSDTLTASAPNNYIALTPAQRKTPANITLANGVDLITVPGTYDYVIITHENFITNIQPLVNYRTTTGGSYSVYVAKIGDVYDSYSGGIFTPQAIKDFLKSAHSGWSTQYALLVGDASVDYKNYLGYGQENFVPTYLVEYSFGQTASDYWFVEGPTNLPIMAIGRLPAKTGSEADTMINKVINYIKPSVPSWNQHAIFVAADDSTSGNVFEPKSDLLISGFSTTTMMFSTIYDRITTPNTNGLIINGINAGALITNYMGHGSVGVWGNGDNGNIGPIFFQSSDAYNYLTNINQLTFLVTLDCLNGFFTGFGENLPNAYTRQNNPLSLSESFLKSSTGGAVAAFSPTGQGFTIKHVDLAQELYKQILILNPSTLGLEIKTAETNVILNSASNLETVSIFVLLGDPATQLALP